MFTKLLVTKGLLLILITIFAMQVLTSPLPTTGLFHIKSIVLISQGAVNWEIISQKDEWFRLFTGAFLHADLLHLAFNCIALWYAALILENLLGGLWFFAVFLIGAMSGSLFSLYFHTAHTVAVGASGGIMGLFACLLIVLRVLPRHIPLRDDGRADALKIIVVSLIPLWGDIFGMKIDIWGHLGGVIGGTVVGFLLYLTWNYQRNKPRLKSLAIIIVLSSLFVLYQGMIEIVKNYSAFSSRDRQASARVEHDASLKSSLRGKL